MMGRTLAISAMLVASAAAPAIAKVHPGDRVAVLVYNHPELSGQATVDGSGNISLPLAGGVNTTNLDAAQISQRVRYRLQPYVRKVAVDVQVLSQAQSIFVAGGPGGVLTYSPGENLSSALAQLRTQTTALGAQPAQEAAFDLDHGRVDLRHVSVVRDGIALGPYDVTTSSTATGLSPMLEPGGYYRAAR